VRRNKKNKEELDIIIFLTISWNYSS